MPRWPSFASLAAVLLSLVAIAVAYAHPAAAPPATVLPGSSARGLAFEDALGTDVHSGKSVAQVEGRYAGLLVRQPPGEETAGIVIDMSGRSERFNEGLYVYTDSVALDHTAGIQVQNSGAADGMHVNLGCRACPSGMLAYNSTAIGVDQWTNGTSYFTFVHGGGRGIDAVLYPSAEDAWAGSFRAASNASGSGELLHLDNAGNPNVTALNVVRGETDLSTTRLHGDAHLEVEGLDDTQAIRFTQTQHHAPAIDANAGWLRVLDEGDGDRERFLVEATTGNVRFTGHVGPGIDDGTRVADGTGSIVVDLAGAYASAPIVSCTPHAPVACYVADASPTRVELKLVPLGTASVAGVAVDVIVRGL